MKTQRYTLTRTWQVPLGWTITETEREASLEFHAEIEELEEHGFRRLTPPTATTGPRDSVTLTCTLRGPAGHQYNEHNQEAA